MGSGRKRQGLGASGQGQNRFSASRISSIRFPPMSHRRDLDPVVTFGIKEYPVFSATEPEASERRLQLFHVADALGEVTIQTVKNLQGGLAVNGAQVSEESPAPSFLRAEFAQDVFVKNRFAAGE